MNIYTKGGDKGTTSLVHTKNVSKSDDRIQLVGIIDISRKNRNLEDAANRNGIQEGPGFTQLKRILLRVIAEFERDRQGVGRKLAAYAKKQDKIEAERQRIWPSNVGVGRKRMSPAGKPTRRMPKTHAAPGLSPQLTLWR